MPVAQMKKVPPSLLHLTEFDHLPTARRLRVAMMTNSKGYIELNLNRQELRMVPAETFQMSATQVLRLAHNQIDYLPMMIAYLRQLRVLDMQHNLLVHLPETLVNCRHLAELQLTANRLTELPKSIGGLRNLRVLALGKNQFEQLPQEVGQLTSLRTLDLQSNKLWHLPFSLQELKRLLQLNISDNMFDHLPLVITKITSLQALNASRNRLATLPLDFDALKSLRELNLSHNKFVSISSMLVTLKHLKYLSLASNGLKFLPSQMSQLQNLRVLHLQDNCLRHVPSMLRQLRYYNVSKNQLTSFSVEGMRALVSLTASCNKVESPPRGMYKLRQLKFLYLDNNDLAELQEDVGLLRELRLLDLSNNQLTHLPQALYQLAKLQSLNVRGNYKLTHTGMGKGGRDKDRIDIQNRKLKQKLVEKGDRPEDPGSEHKINLMDKPHKKQIVSLTGKMYLPAENDRHEKDLSSNGQLIKKTSGSLDGTTVQVPDGSMTSDWELRAKPNDKNLKSQQKAGPFLQKPPRKPESMPSLRQEPQKPKKSHSVKSLKDLFFRKSKKAKTAKSETRDWDHHATMRTSTSLHLPMHYSMQEVDKGRSSRKTSLTTRTSSIGRPARTDIDEMSLGDQRSYRTYRNDFRVPGRGQWTDGDVKSQGYGTWTSRARRRSQNDLHSYMGGHINDTPFIRNGLQTMPADQSSLSNVSNSDIVYVPYHRNGRPSHRAPLFHSSNQDQFHLSGVKRGHTSVTSFSQMHHDSIGDRRSEHWYGYDPGKSTSRSFYSTSSPDFTIREAQASFRTESSPTNHRRPYSYRETPGYSPPSYRRETRSLPISALASRDHSLREANMSFVTETPSHNRVISSRSRAQPFSYQPYFTGQDGINPPIYQPTHKTKYPPYMVFTRKRDSAPFMRSYKSDSMLNFDQSDYNLDYPNPNLTTHKHYASQDHLFDPYKSEDTEEFGYTMLHHKTKNASDWVYGSHDSLRSADTYRYPSHIRSHTMTLPHSTGRPESDSASHISDYVDYDDNVDQRFTVKGKYTKEVSQHNRSPDETNQFQMSSQFDHVLSTKNFPFQNQDNSHFQQGDPSLKHMDDNFIIKTKKEIPMSRSMDFLMDLASNTEDFSHINSNPQFQKPQKATNKKAHSTQHGVSISQDEMKKGAQTDYTLLGVCNQVETLLNKNLLQPVIGFNHNGSHRFSEKTIREKAEGLWRLDQRDERQGSIRTDDADNSTDDDSDNRDVPALEYSQPQTFTLTNAGGQYVSSEGPEVVVVDVPPHATSKPLHVTIQLLFIAPVLLHKVQTFNNFVDNLIDIGPVVYFHTTRETNLNSQATLTIPAPASVKGGQLQVLTIRKDNSCIPCSSGYRSGKFAVTMSAWHFTAKVAVITKAKCKYKACKSMEQLLQCIGATQISQQT